VTFVEFGLQLPVQAQSKLMASPWESDAGPAEIERVARCCDAGGFDHIGVCDHIAIPADVASRMSTTWYDTVATLGWLAALTERVRLLSHVYVIVYRHPLATAKAFATLDALSGGRVILGVGVGHVEAEFEALGVPFARRGELADEMLPRLKAALADEWGWGSLGQRPRPVQPGGPPVWVGGSSRPALRRAARLGDGWLPQGPPPGGLEETVRFLTDERESVGESMDDFAVGWGVTCRLDGTSPSARAEVLQGAAQVIDHVGQLEAAGVTHVQVRVPSGSCDELVEQLERFSTEVVPAFA
jgi:probable F420-dependent oxidoreductase